MTHVRDYINDAVAILHRIDQVQVDKVIDLLVSIREEGGRLFFLGVGGSAANCSHAVNDFRKIGGFEAYSPVDNVSELTARVNDEGWETIFVEWLKGSRLCSKDALFILSVGGGSQDKKISANLVRALEYGLQCRARIVGIVGRDGGFTATVADACIIIPVVNSSTVTAHSESFQTLCWHLMITDPRLMRSRMKWESTQP